ncbi:hypothetical protein Ping_3065 [Psychromonas ingrahamii 37]|uniref:Uncharacterized protein n=1 Tax=Psychromonas ingrahamii (strain DSM 17664 / CCUG 51855 / 37) TaxID=357804 RepID=A1SZ50_PSYIN|nr:hypothetical protein [Psychromonas ingrahamii]ABM04765.1 hypothetical protein Ping_3065 [Psychromonas ingrahamii 37]
MSKKSALGLFICLCQFISSNAIATDSIITGTTDLSTSWLSGGSIQFNNSLCVGLGAPATTYKVRMTGSGSGNSFSLQKNATDTLEYTIEWASQSGQTSGFSATSGVYITGQPSGQSTDCSAKNATLIVKISAAQLQQAKSGSHTGTITITVEPE